MIPLDRPKSLAAEVVRLLMKRIRSGQYPAGVQLPSEAALVRDFGVSRTVVREAISQLQASGVVQTRHGVGTFVLGEGQMPFRVDREQLTRLKDVVKLLELRMGIEVSAVTLAAERRTAEHLKRMKKALQAFDRAVREGEDSVAADFAFHYEIALATQNEYFSSLMNTLGPSAIPRGRLQEEGKMSAKTLRYLQQVDAEHNAIFTAIEQRDARAAAQAMRNHLTRGLERRSNAATALERSSKSS